MAAIHFNELLTQRTDRGGLFSTGWTHVLNYSCVTCCDVLSASYDDGMPTMQSMQPQQQPLEEVLPLPTFVAACLLFKIGRKWTCLGSRQMHQGRGSRYLLSALHPGGGESGRMRTDGGQLLAHLLPTFLPLLLFLSTSPLPQHIPSTSPLPLRLPHHFPS